MFTLTLKYGWIYHGWTSIEQNITMSSKIGVKFSSGGFRTDFCNLLVCQLKFLFWMVG